MTATATPPLPVVPCAGIPIAACDRATAAAAVIGMASAERDTGADIHLCNAYTLSLADRDQELRRMLGRATVNFPDGMSVVWANRLLHRSRDLPRERVYGPDLFLDVLAHGQHLRHYLIGGTPEVLAALQAELSRRFPEATIVGAESPPFRPITDAEWSEQAQRLALARAQIVWLGLGTPKQDWVAADLAARHPAVYVAVGAAFDFVAGTKSQAPRWMQRNGLEWVFRLVTEPRRLWRRYLIGNAIFLRAVAAGRARPPASEREGH